MNSAYRSLGLGFVAVAMGALPLACATDDKTSSSGLSGSNDADGGGIYSKLGVPPPAASADGGLTPQPFDFKDVKSPYDDVASCKTFSSADVPKDFHSDQRACLCDNCFDLMQECDALQGCQQIMKCILDIQCTDSNSCYLAPQKTALDPDGKGCVEVIDRWGNAGVATALSNNIGTCSTPAGCIKPAGK
jgi:hypothetical protein